MGKRKIILAPAKLNLTLHVGEKGLDGYHDICSTLIFLSLADKISIFPLEHQEEGIVFLASGPFASQLPEEIKDNLIYKAIQVFFQELGFPPPAFRIHLEKNIPAGAGLGGGSADAAAILRYLGDVHQLPLEKLLILAQRLGSDVPACVVAKPCFIKGRGDRVIQLETSMFYPLYGLVIYPGVVLSTAAVYRCFDDHPLHLPYNDLEKVAQFLEPEVGACLDMLLATPGCLSARISGSGSSCFGLYNNRETLEKAYNFVQTKKKSSWYAYPFT